MPRQLLITKEQLLGFYATNQDFFFPVLNEKIFINKVGFKKDEYCSIIYIIQWKYYLPDMQEKR